jgi:hypothetical protein
MLRVRGVARFRFSLRENSRFHFAVFADFAQGAKRVAELAASRVAVFPIERHILIDNPRGVFDVLDDSRETAEHSIFVRLRWSFFTLLFQTVGAEKKIKPRRPFLFTPLVSGA